MGSGRRCRPASFPPSRFRSSLAPCRVNFLHPRMPLSRLSRAACGRQDQSVLSARYAPMPDPILCEISEGIATLTLNRPEKLNAIDYAMADRLMALLDEFEPAAGVGALIVTGAGDTAF